MIDILLLEPRVPVRGVLRLVEFLAPPADFVDESGLDSVVALALFGFVAKFVLEVILFAVARITLFGGL